MQPAATTPGAAWGQLHAAISQLGSGVNQAVINLSSSISDDAEAMAIDIAGASFYVHRELWLDTIALNKSVQAIASKVTDAIAAQLAEAHGGLRTVHDAAYGTLAARIDALAQVIGA